MSKTLSQQALTLWVIGSSGHGRYVLTCVGRKHILIDAVYRRLGLRMYLGKSKPHYGLTNSASVMDGFQKTLEQLGACASRWKLPPSPSMATLSHGKLVEYRLQSLRLPQPDSLGHLPPSTQPTYPFLSSQHTPTLPPSSQCHLRSSLPHQPP